MGVHYGFGSAESRLLAGSLRAGVPTGIRSYPGYCLKGKANLNPSVTQALVR